MLSLPTAMAKKYPILPLLIPTEERIVQRKAVYQMALGSWSVRCENNVDSYKGEKRTPTTNRRLINLHHTDLRLSLKSC